MALTIDNLNFDINVSANLVAGILAGTARHHYQNKPVRGTAAGQADLVVAKDLAINVGGATSLDLTSIADPGGGLVTFVKLTHIALINLSVVAGEHLNLFGGANAIFAVDPKKVYSNGGIFLWAAPDLGVTIDATHKIFQIAADAGAAVPAKLFLAGRSA